MTLLFHLRLSGFLLIIMGLGHVPFGSYLNWKSDLLKLTLVNRQIFWVHCFYIALALTMLGLLCVFMSGTLLKPDPLSRAVMGGMTLIWTIRLIIQWGFFEKSLWREHKVHRSLHYLLTALWLYLVTVDGTVLAASFRAAARRF